MNAAEIRREWMQLMWLTEQEIAEANVIEPPIDTVYEQRQLDAIREIRK